MLYKTTYIMYTQNSNSLIDQKYTFLHFQYILQFIIKFPTLQMGIEPKTILSRSISH